MAAGVALLATACASVEPAPPVARPEHHAAVPGFSFADDTFAFPNDIRARNADRDDVYANYCFVMARGLRQFFAFARFDPGGPRLSPDTYTERVREIAARPPWEPPMPVAERIVIPGYSNLRDFSTGQELALKAGLGSRFWTMVHWTNWRVVFPVKHGQQATVAREVMDDIDAGRLVQLLVTNWPKPELNHGIVAYGYRAGPRGVEFEVWDPNDPHRPGVMTFESDTGRFDATRIFDTVPGPIRAFRMSYSWLL
jgi:hypothetical protein